MSNNQIEQIISTGEPMHTGIGGTSLKIKINHTPIFVKKIPITDRELQADNYMSTANMFNLPMCYQYGIGSAGFGAWRELATHKITTNWVITGECYNFPIMYHWRILTANIKNTISRSERDDLDQDTIYWENNKEIHNRLKEKLEATQSICLFIEFIPENLHEWLSKQSLNDTFIDTVKLVENQIQETIDFMGSRNLLHMDAHFRNILTDGSRLYYSDFGLALSSQFQLSMEEKKFFYKNITYDKSSGILYLLNCIITSISKRRNIILDDVSSFTNKLNQYKRMLNHEIKEIISSEPASLDMILKDYMPIAIKMDEFYYCLMKKDKSTQYPNNVFEKLLNNIGWD
ncbi:protein kinase [Francisella adeliensis]|nr:protein kinase [Francisella adeliensis]